MLAVLTVCLRCAAEQDAAVEVAVEGIEDFTAQVSVLLLEQRFPAALKLVAEMIDDAVKSGLLGLSSAVGCSTGAGGCP